MRGAVLRAGRAVGADGRFADLGLVHRSGEAVHLLLVGEELAQLVRQVGMLAQQLLAVGLLPGIDGLQVGMQDRFQLVVRVKVRS